MAREGSEQRQQQDLPTSTEGLWDLLAFQVSDGLQGEGPRGIQRDMGDGDSFIPWFIQPPFTGLLLNQYGGPTEPVTMQREAMVFPTSAHCQGQAFKRRGLWGWP